jgi:hypothetical protein
LQEAREGTVGWRTYAAERLLLKSDIDADGAFEAEAP